MQPLIVSTMKKAYIYINSLNADNNFSQKLNISKGFKQYWCGFWGEWVD